MTVASVPFVEDLAKAQALHGGHRTLSLSSSASSPSFVWKPGPAVGPPPRGWPGCQKLLGRGAGPALSCVHRRRLFLRVTPGGSPRCEGRGQADGRCGLARALVQVQPDAAAPQHCGIRTPRSRGADLNVCVLPHGPMAGGPAQGHGGPAVSFQPLSLSHTLR